MTNEPAASTLQTRLRIQEERYQNLLSRFVAHYTSLHSGNIDGMTAPELEYALEDLHWLKVQLRLHSDDTRLGELEALRRNMVIRLSELQARQ